MQATSKHGARVYNSLYIENSDNLTKIIFSQGRPFQILNIRASKIDFKDARFISICPKLLKITFSDCPDLTKENLNIILKGKKLKVVELSNCPKIDKKFFELHPEGWEKACTIPFRISSNSPQPPKSIFSVNSDNFEQLLRTSLQIPSPALKGACLTYLTTYVDTRLFLICLKIAGEYKDKKLAAFCLEYLIKNKLTFSKSFLEEVAAIADQHKILDLLIITWSIFDIRAFEFPPAINIAKSLECLSLYIDQEVPVFLINPNYNSDPEAVQIIKDILISPRWWCVQGVKLFVYDIKPENSHVIECLHAILEKSRLVMDFYNNGLPLDACKVIKMIENNTSLSELGLCNDVGINWDDDQSQAFANAFDGNKTIKTVTLENFNFNQNGTKALAVVLSHKNQAVINLNLSCNSYRGETELIQIASIVEHNKFIKELNLSKCYPDHPHRPDMLTKGLEALGQALKKNESLENLDFSFNHATDEELAPLLEALEENQSLQHLNLDHNKLEKTNVAAMIEKNRALTSITLNRNYQLSKEKIGEIIAAIKNHPALKEVNFARLYNLDTALIQELCKLDLETLNLSGIRLKKEAVISVGQLLEENKSIENLYLYDCGLKDNTLEILIESLKKNHTVKNLDLSGNKKISDGWGKFVQFLHEASLEKLDLDACDMGADWGVQMIQAVGKNHSITEFCLSANFLGGEVVEPLIEMLRNNNNLRKFDAFDNGFSRDDLAKITKVSSPFLALSLGQ